MAAVLKVLELRPRACNSKEAAKYIGVSDVTLKKSRSSGVLMGVDTPAYKKAGHSIIYEISTLDEWLDSLPMYKNTADEAFR